MASLETTPTRHSVAEEVDCINIALREALALGRGCPAVLAEAMRYAVLGPGKRLRPRLVRLAVEACGGDPDVAMPAACAVEMIHAYSLVHDDLPAMDDDDLRRGRPTCHIQFDEATAILVGDALQARAFELLATRIRPADVAVRCCAELARAAGAENLVGGQSADLTGAFEGATADDLRAIHARKTGAMFIVSLRLGGILGGASEQQLQHLTDYAQAIGLAFQVTDDLLDITGNQQAVGKRLGKDDGRGKLTYPSLMGEEASRQLVFDLVESACRAVEPFGKRAKPLADLARALGERDR
jgi:geranylgeranyl diphosphate synthase type II